MTTSQRLAYFEGMIQELVDLGMHEDGRGYRTLTIDEIGYGEDGKPEILFGTMDTWHPAAGAEDGNTWIRGQASPAVIGEHEGFEPETSSIDEAIEISQRIDALQIARAMLLGTLRRREPATGFNPIEHPLLSTLKAEISELEDALINLA